ncbi:MAG: (2Fe-2S)-binding protein [Anaerolineae bacterium]|jgi:carbon-monoxide dehydrogenase small subunit|nr:(2Fe-2S)-binding protein [Anaerolineae bacterium]
MPLVFTLNGDEIRLDDIPDGMLLVDVLRDHLGLTGTKRGCETGTCGMCSVLVDGVLTRSCRTKAIDVAGRLVTTIEGIHGPDGALSDLQAAFLEHGAVQCGYCTPAMVLAAEALLRRHSDPTREQIRSAINGILCRCTGYMQIVDAIEATAAVRAGRNRRTGQNRTAGRRSDREQER